MSATARMVAAAFSAKQDVVPPIIDTERFRTGIQFRGQPCRYEPVFEQPSIFHLNPQAKPRFIGWELVQLQWMKPDGKGGLIPAE